MYSILFTWEACLAISLIWSSETWKAHLLTLNEQQRLWRRAASSTILACRDLDTQQLLLTRETLPIKNMFEWLIFLMLKGLSRLPSSIKKACWQRLANLSSGFLFHQWRRTSTSEPPKICAFVLTSLFQFTLRGNCLQCWQSAAQRGLGSSCEADHVREGRWQRSCCWGSLSFSEGSHRSCQ